jgi:hypothetical protein
MKTRIQKIIKSALLIFVMCFASCSTEPVEEEYFETLNFKIDRAETAEDQLEMLTKAMRRFHNFEVAVAQGYVQVSPLVDGMGIHYAKEEYVDMEFNLLKPEILVYHPDENGEYQFVAAEYLIPVEDCDPNVQYTVPDAGFIGDQDHWHLNCVAGGWTLHAWVGLENPAGVFAPFNPSLQ